MNATRAQRLLPWALAGLLAAAPVLLHSAPCCAAATSTLITNINDSGPGSLRQAIADANNATNAVVITFAPGLAHHTIVLNSVADSSLLPSALAVSGDLTIDGSDAPQLVISGVAGDPTRNLRLFLVNASANLTLRNLTVSNGRIKGGDGTGTGSSAHGCGGGGAGLGGAIFNQGHVQIEGCTLTGHFAIGGNGGPCGIPGAGAGGGPNGGIPGVTNVYGNGGAGGPGGFGGGGGGGGGGFFGLGGGGGDGGFGGGGGGGGWGSDGVGDGGRGGFGGGDGSMPNGGGGAGMGGAIFNNGGTILIKNSTFTDNSAIGGFGWHLGLGLGGAIFNRNGVVTLLNATVAGNDAPDGGGGAYNLGDENLAQLTLQNSIVTANIGTGDIVNNGINTGFGLVLASAPNIVATIITLGGSATDASGVSVADPLLEPLALNGGPTQTMALAPSSPAVDAADPGLAPPTDQRGRGRYGPPDIGAFEVTAPSTPPTVTDIPKTCNEDSVLRFSRADFLAHFSDPDAGDSLYLVKITSLPAHGVLKLSGVPVMSGDELILDDLDNLSFWPRWHWNGSTTFGWNGADSLGPIYAASRANVILTVNPINTPPVAGAGQALLFDGVNDYITLPSFALAAPLTVEAWVNASNPFANYARIFDFGDGPGHNNIELGFANTSGQMALYVYNGSERTGVLTTPAVFPANQWVHVAVTIDGGGTAAIYWNGVLQASGVTGAPPAASRAQQYLGRSNWISDAYFAGQMDEIRIWNGVRAQADLQTAMYTPLTGAEPGLAAYWRCDEDADITLYDSTSNELDATLSADPAEARVVSEAWKYRKTDTNARLVIAAGYDIDSPSLFLTQISAPVYGTLTFDNYQDQVNYYPPADVSGQDQFVYQISDGTFSDTYAVVVNFGTNHLPRAGGLFKPPAAMNSTVHFTAADFTANFFDPDLGDQLTKIMIMSLPDHGTLQLGQTVLRAGDEIAAGALGQLSFTPPAGWHGQTVFDWNGADACGPAYAASPGWARLFIDALPVISDITKAAADEDHSVSFTSQDFTSHSGDADIGDSLSKIKLTALPAHGTLYLNGAVLAVNAEIAVADLGGLVFTPDANWNGSTNFGWNGADADAGLYAASPARVILTINPVNDPPQISDVTMASGNQDHDVVFAAADFTAHFSDVDTGDSLSQIAVLSLPAHGTLKLNGIPVGVNADILTTDLNGLSFTPQPGWYGHTSFTWNGADTGGPVFAAVSATVYLTINAVNHPPLVSDITKAAVDENQFVQFTPGDFTSHFTDVDPGDQLSKIMITALPQHGVVALNGVALGLNAEIPAIGLSVLTFTPDPNWSGHTSFGWNGADSGGVDVVPVVPLYGTGAVVNLTVNWVDQPPAVANVTKAAVDENHDVLFTTSDFAAQFTDGDPGDSLSQIKIISLPGHGTLKLNGAPVSVGEEIAASNLGLLSFTPDAYWNGQSSFGWNGMESDGSFYAPVAATVFMTVNAVNYPPQVISPVTSAPTQPRVNHPAVFTVGATDPDGDTLAYSWDFNDGTVLAGGASITHTFVKLGLYQVKVTVSDGEGGTASNTAAVTVGIAGGEEDSDGDGFSDEIELALQSNPADAESTPGNLPSPVAAGALPVSKMAVKLNFAKLNSNKDSISMSGTLPVPKDFSADKQNVIVDCGGIVRAFTLNAQGRSPTGNDTFKLGFVTKHGEVAAQTGSFALALTKGSFAAALADEKLLNANVTSATVTIDVTLIIGGKVYFSPVVQTYKAKKNVSGSTVKK